MLPSPLCESKEGLSRDIDLRVPAIGLAIGTPSKQNNNKDLFAQPTSHRSTGQVPMDRDRLDWTIRKRSHSGRNQRQEVLEILPKPNTPVVDGVASDPV